MLVLAIIKVAIASAGQVAIRLPAYHDDSYYISQAKHLADGEWRGPYEERTLMKGVGYPLFLALVHFTGIPYLIVLHGLYALCALMLFGLLRRAGVPALPALLAYGIALFNTITFHDNLMRPVPDGFYSVLTFALILFLFGLYLKLPSVRIPHFIVLGLMVSWLWISRAEGPWLVPVLAVAGLAGYWKMRSTALKKKALRACAAAIGAFTVSLSAIAAMNYWHYEAFLLTDFPHDPWQKATAALRRARPANEPWDTVSMESLRKVTEVSPTFARLGFPGLHTEVDVPVAKVAWRLRHRVYEAFEAPTHPKVSALLNRLSDEINDACEQARLACRPFHATFYQPNRLTPRRWANEAVRHFNFLLGWTGEWTYPYPLFWKYEDYSRSPQLALASQVLNETWEPEPGGKRWGPFINFLNDFYRTVVPGILWIAIALWISAMALGIRHPANTLVLFCVTALTSRIAVLSAIEVSWFRTSHFLYYLQSYVLLSVIVFVPFACLPEVLTRLKNLTSGLWPYSTVTRGEET